MNEIINDWKPETKSLLKSLTDAGCVLVEGDNGEDTFKFKGDLNDFIENLIACDESTLYVTTPGKAPLAGIYLVLGNSPGEIASDYVCRPEIDKAVEAHYAKWEGRKQPKTTRTSRYGGDAQLSRFPVPTTVETPLASDGQV